VKQEYVPLVEGQAGVDEVWPLEAGADRAPAALGTLRARVAAARFEVAVDWQSSPRSRALLAGLPRVLRWRAERWARRRWVFARWSRPAALRPAWLRYADALAPLGVVATNLAPPRFVPPRGAAARAAAFLADWEATPGAGSGSIVGLAPGARWATKRWPAAAYAALAVARRAAGERVLLVGDAADRSTYEAERTAGGSRDNGAIPEDPGMRWFAGSLAETAAVLARTRAVVANDSGLLHLAAAAGRPVVAIMASTHPGLGFAPAGAGHAVLCRDLDCQPCTLHGRESCPRGHHRCARDLTPGAVAAALERVRD
jgi:heptosyltransferase-2